MLTELYIEGFTFMMRRWQTRYGRLGIRGEIDDAVVFITWMMIALRG